jgi:hypothetical protein
MLRVILIGVAIIWGGSIALGIGAYAATKLSTAFQSRLPRK